MSKIFDGECGSIKMTVHRDPLLWLSRKRLINFILNDNNGCYLSTGPQENITKQNYTTADIDHSFTDLFTNCFFKSFAKSMLNKRGIKLSLVNVWYQVYDGHKTMHGWHNHEHDGVSELRIKCGIVTPTFRYSNVLYLELPDKKIATQFVDISNNDIVSPKVRQGDTISFETKIYHRSPPNKTNKRKIVVSFNTYGEVV